MKVFCINLTTSTDRKKLIQQEFDRVGLYNVEYISADQPPSNFTMNNMRRNPSAEFGCNLSHLKAITNAVIQHKERALFVEDDIVFKQHLNLDNAPVDWDLIYLDGHPRSPIKQVQEGLYKVGKFCFADAYIMKYNTMVRFINYWFDRVTEKNAMFDFVLGDFANQVNSYAFYPTVCHQRDGYSIIGKKQDTKSNLMGSWSKWK